MRPLKPSVKSAIVSTLVVSSTALGIYAVDKAKENKVEDIGNKIKLDIEKVDSDTVKVSLDNIADIPKALQFSIKLDGPVKLADGQNSIHDLVNKEAQRRIKEKTVAESTNNILTDYTYNESDNSIDVLITSDSSIPKTNNRVDVFELDVISVLKSAPSYKVVPVNEGEYKYVSTNNKEYAGLGVVHDNETITMNIAPTITLNKPYVEVVEGESLDLTKENLGITMEDKDGNEGLRLEVKENGKVITTFKKDTPGVYNLECVAIDKYSEKSEVVNLQVNVALEEVTEKPVITRDGKALEDITINGGDIFKPLENLKAVDAKGRELDVKLSVDKELNLDPETDTVYNLTYTATDMYSNKTEVTIKLTVIANKAPVISGVKDHTLKVGDVFDPKEGVKVSDEDKNIELKIDSNVDTSVAGEYKVLYSATDSKGKTTRAQSNVVVNPKTSVVNNIPKINARDKVIKVGDKFEPLNGVSASDKEDGDITKDIKVVEDNVDVNKAGVYTVKYSVEDSKGAKAIKTITVTVKDKLSGMNSVPTINANDKSIKVGDKFDALDGVSANDKEDGDITSKIKVVENNVESGKVGGYTVTYSVEDSKGAKTTKTITVTVNPKVSTLNHAPVINATDKEIQSGEKFDALKGVSASDKEDGDITKDIKVEENNVDSSKVGEYTVTYSVKDSKEAKTTKTINVTVEYTPVGEGSGPDGDVMPEVTPETTEPEKPDPEPEIPNPEPEIPNPEPENPNPGPGTDESEKPGGNLKPEDETEEGNKSPSTGDTSILRYAFTGIVAMGAMIGINYKKNKK